MLFSTLSTALVLLAGSANAMPSPHQQAANYTPAHDLCNLAPLFPQSALPSPNGLQLKYLALGVGTQNYTCTTGNETAAPGTTGAVATLYDIGSKLNNDPVAKWRLDSITPVAVSLSTQPDLLAESLKCQGFHHIIGHHFFTNVSGVDMPTFSLDALAQPYPFAILTKLNQTDAPATSYPGSNGLGATPWLYLKDTKGTAQGGINTVYRVQTAGGKQPATCKGMPSSWEVPYAAQYWVYGPPQ